MSNEHNWSGWPGAWCLNCGVADQGEICVAECDWVCRAMDAELKGEPIPQPCSKHYNLPCAEPGSNRHNPYIQTTTEMSKK